MSKIKWISLLLLLLVILDATGDAFRVNGWQKIHHSAESLQIAVWMFLCVIVYKYRIFNPIHIVMYVLARLWAFDLTLNAIAGNHLLYMGENDFVGSGVQWFAGLFKQNYYHFSFMLKFLSLFVWSGWFWTDRIFRKLKTVEN